MRRAALAIPLACWAGVLPAQTMRPFATYRQAHAETRLDAKLEFAAGSLRVLPGRKTDLYRMTLSYDAERFTPLSRYDPASGKVTLGVESVGGAGLRAVSGEHLKQLAAVELSPAADLALDLTLGASEADIELGGLRVTDLRLQTGASRTTLRFSQPNGVRCRSATVTSAAAEVLITGLGNSRCDRLQLEGGIGRATLDFSGAWKATQRVEARMAIGDLKLRLPKGLPLRIAMDRFLARFDSQGLERRGQEWVTPGFDPAAAHVELVLKAAIGGVTLEWVP